MATRVTYVHIYTHKDPNSPDKPHTSRQDKHANAGTHKDRRTTATLAHNSNACPQRCTHHHSMLTRKSSSGTSSIPKQLG